MVQSDLRTRSKLFLSFGLMIGLIAGCFCDGI